MSQNWFYSGQIELPGDKLIFHNGQPGKKSILANKNVINHDDYIELEIKTKFDKNVSTIQNQKYEDRINGFFIHLSRGTAGKLFIESLDKEYVVLDGLVIMFLTHDSNEDESLNEQNYFVTYRYFSKPFQLGRDYFNIILEKKELFESCDFRALMKKLIDLKITIDFEVSNSLTFDYKDDSASSYTRCFEITNIFKYLTKSQIYLLLQQTNGNKYTLSTNIENIELREKKQRLDIDNSLLVSHHLLEEIFDKVDTFSQIAENDKESMVDLIELQNSLIRRASVLEVYTKDLQLGSKKFQEFMFESLNQHKVFSPANMPKLMDINQKIEYLNEIQKKIYKRFVDIKSIINSKKIFEKTFNNFKRINNLVRKLVNEISSKEFKGFLKRTKKFSNIIKKLDFDRFMQQIENTISSQADNSKTTSLISLIIVFVACISLFTFAGLILKNIKQSQHSQFE